MFLLIFTESTDVSLDTYLARNTSEDNASFAEIIRDNQEKHKQKHMWLYEKEQESIKVSQHCHLSLFFSSFTSGVCYVHTWINCNFQGSHAPWNP